MQADLITPEERAEIQAKNQEAIRNRKHYIATRFGSVIEAKSAENIRTEQEATIVYHFGICGMRALFVGENAAFQIHAAENVFTNREWAVQRASERLKTGK